MGLYMQLSVSTRQAGHGEIENHISGNGRCEVRSTSPPSVIHLLLLLPLLVFFFQFILIYSFLVVDEGTPEGLCGESDAICSHAEEELKQRSGTQPERRLNAARCL